MEQSVRSFPRLPVLFAHGLFPEFADAFGMVERYDTVRLEMTNVVGALWDDRYRAKKLETQGTLDEISRTLDGRDFADTVKENLPGETAPRLVERFKPGFFSRVPAAPRA